MCGGLQVGIPARRNLPVFHMLVVHRDISENNIIIDPETGMLIDLDLAIVDGERTGGRHMTSTMEFRRNARRLDSLTS